MSQRLMEKLQESAEQPVIFPVYNVKKFLTIMRRSRKQISEALDGIAGEFRTFYTATAKGDWEVAWRAFSTGIRSHYRKGLEKGTPEYADADRLARGVLTPVRARLSDIAPAVEQPERVKTRVSVNIKQDPPRTLLNVATGILIALSERELEDLAIKDLQATLEALEKVQKALSARQMEEQKETKKATKKAA